MPRKQEGAPRSRAEPEDGHDAGRRRQPTDPQARRKQAGPSKATPEEKPRRPDEGDPHVDETLDAGLEETFPASDPVSISRGAD